MSAIKRIRVEIEGIVQGVGFRPFIYRLAARHSLSGWVRNTPAGVLLEAEGAGDAVSSFLLAIKAEAPPLAVISLIQSREIIPTGESKFLILPSTGGENQIQIAPDGDVCSDCLEEMFDPANRRFRYPFINCTNCGPRFSIIRAIPYDRPLTTMAVFTMCADCRAEYEDPGDRRFHAQPNACPVCGPRLRLTDPKGRDCDGDTLETAVSLLRNGRILAVKGTGGFHLAVDPFNDDAVRELRRRKNRDEKPFALISPSLAEAERHVVCDDLEKRLLAAMERPIVILPKQAGTQISPLVAPANGYFGVMLPATPLQHLLLRDNFTALVMTSGNITDEPVIHQDAEAYKGLAGIADFFLTHDRDIHARSDDSVIRVFQGNPLFLRRSRGYVPRAVTLPAPMESVLAVGGELKNTVCLTRGERAFLSPHIGDLKNIATLQSLEVTVAHLTKILEITPVVIAHDLHPDYISTGFAGTIGDTPKIAVQHHHAHMASCMAENRLEGEVIGVIFDGAGYGLDGNVWGGEFLLGSFRSFERRGHFRYVPMPGGDAAAKEPFRMAISFLHALYGDSLFDLPLPCLSDVTEMERKLFLQVLEKKINAPLTSSCGRVFDAVAALVGLRYKNSYEGQAAIELEALAEQGKSDWYYPYAILREEGKYQIDFRLSIEAILQDIKAGDTREVIARRFHDTVATASADMCEKIRRESGADRVVLSGGVFQNKLLTEKLHDILTGNGFQVFTHRLVPPNDGGLALGQAAVAGYNRTG